MYLELARFQNLHPSTRYNIQLICFDKSNNLKQGFDRLSAGGTKPTNIRDAKSYFGTHNVSRTMTMIASTTIRSDSDVTAKPGSIINAECPDLFIDQWRTIELTQLKMR